MDWFLCFQQPIMVRQSDNGTHSFTPSYLHDPRQLKVSTPLHTPATCQRRQRQLGSSETHLLEWIFQHKLEVTCPQGMQDRHFDPEQVAARVGIIFCIRMAAVAQKAHAGDDQEQLDTNHDSS